MNVGIFLVKFSVWCWRYMIWGDWMSFIGLFGVGSILFWEVCFIRYWSV